VKSEGRLLYLLHVVLLMHVVLVSHGRIVHNSGFSCGLITQIQDMVVQDPEESGPFHAFQTGPGEACLEVGPGSKWGFLTPFAKAQAQNIVIVDITDYSYR
jgi:hypothetical protein